MADLPDGHALALSDGPDETAMMAECANGSPALLVGSFELLQAAASVALHDDFNRRLDETFRREVIGTGPANITGLLGVLNGSGGKRVTSGWVCPQCSNVMAPFIISCPFCAKTAGRTAAPEPRIPPPGGRTLPGPFAMTMGAEYGFTVIGEWTEVFPDLQCRLFRAIYTYGSAEPAAAELIFRRTPQGASSAKETD
jgi:hypothetical protein